MTGSRVICYFSQAIIRILALLIISKIKPQAKLTLPWPNSILCLNLSQAIIRILALLIISKINPESKPTLPLPNSILDVNII